MAARGQLRPAALPDLLFGVLEVLDQAATPQRPASTGAVAACLLVPFVAEAAAAMRALAQGDQRGDVRHSILTQACWEFSHRGCLHLAWCCMYGDVSPQIFGALLHHFPIRSNHFLMRDKMTCREAMVELQRLVQAMACRMLRL